MSKPIPKRHHYIPEMLQKRFVNESGGLFVDLVLKVGMPGPPFRWRLSRPVPEGPREAAQLGIAERRRDLAEGHAALGQQLACDLEPKPVHHDLVCSSLPVQVSAQGATV